MTVISSMQGFPCTHSSIISDKIKQVVSDLGECLESFCPVLIQLVKLLCQVQERLLYIVRLLLRRERKFHDKAVFCDVC